MAHGEVNVRPNLVAIDRDMNFGHFNLVHETKKLSMTSVRRAGSRLRLATFLIVFAALAASHRGASAEAGYPNKSVRIVLPFAAGGVADTTARIIAEKLGDKLGQRFYVENQAGAGGIAAARTVISSTPDGHTLAMLTNGTAISVSLFKKLPFDPLKDFEPISSLGYFDFILATGASPEPALAAAATDAVQRIHRLLGPAEPPLSRVRRQLLGAAVAAIALTPVVLALAPAVVALALGRVPGA